MLARVGRLDPQQLLHLLLPQQFITSLSKRLQLLHTVLPYIALHTLIPCLLRPAPTPAPLNLKFSFQAKLHRPIYLISLTDPTPLHSSSPSVLWPGFCARYCYSYKLQMENKLQIIIIKHLIHSFDYIKYER